MSHSRDDAHEPPGGDEPHGHAHPRSQGHAHPHSHGHGHGHGHDQEHEQRRPAAPREQLAPGAGAGKTLFFDCFSGVAGDMTIAALFDLGVPRAVFEQAVGALGLEGYELVWSELTRSGIVAAHFDVRVHRDQPHRSYGAIDDMLADAALDEPVRRLARAIFRRLGEAEAEVHRMPLRDVHFHEVGAVDAIVDIVGAAAGLAYLGCDVVVSPLPIGRGFVRAQHGVLPLPAPAVISCLAGAPTVPDDLDVELVTPTGAAIVASSARAYARWPRMAPERVGYGAGTRRLADRPNLLRLVLGKPEPGASSETSHVLVEANVDDLTGELAAHALGALLQAGALDAWAAPITMKKGRPGLVIAALATRAGADAVSAALLRETTTIGVRMTGVTRTERPRRVVRVRTRFGAIAVKVSGGDWGPPQVKPEFDDCARAAAEHAVPVREVLAAALAAYHASELADDPAG